MTAWCGRQRFLRIEEDSPLYRSSDVIIIGEGPGTQKSFLASAPAARKNFPLLFYADHRMRPYTEQIIEDALK